MVRTLNHVEDEETPDSSSPTDRKRVDQKGNALRSKHSETEQRRRSKINQRFQILRQLIPENDQKRDKASLLLDVIQYIQFLHEKLQIYEGSCHGWSSEQTKLTPWKANSGQLESFVDQSHLERLLSGHEENVVQSPTLPSSAQNSVELDLARAALNKPIVKLQMAANQGLPLNMLLQQPAFEGMPGQHHQGSVPDSEQFTQQLLSQFWRGKSSLEDCSFPFDNGNEEALKTENGEDGFSSAYSQGLLNSLTNALQSLGVDLSQANISVQLDIGKRTNGGSTGTTFDMKDHEDLSSVHSVAPVQITENYEHPQKRLRADEC